MDFEQMLKYCAALRTNNDRVWFHENHKWYEEARQDYIALLERLRFVIAESAPDLANDILPMQARDWMYRVARDMRYSKNKPPYNPAFRAYISADRKSWLPIGYFLRISPGESCFGTGLWCENTEQLNRVRSYMIENSEEFTGLLIRSKLELSGDKLKKVPRGYNEKNPETEWAKYKNWAILVDIPDNKLTTFANFEERIQGLVKRMEPIRQFLLRSVRTEQTYKSVLTEFYNL